VLRKRKVGSREIQKTHAWWGWLKNVADAGMAGYGSNHDDEQHIFTSVHLDTHCEITSSLRLLVPQTHVMGLMDQAFNNDDFFS
jgi:hypothetical protein